MTLLYKLVTHVKEKDKVLDKVCTQVHFWFAVKMYEQFIVLVRNSLNN
mgnify:CR=1 FL=1